MRLDHVILIYLASVVAVVGVMSSIALIINNL